MSEFQHSIVLFCGDDGLPLEFNVRNTNQKSFLKALIEHGGGLCTQSDNAVHLISPGTKALNVDLGKKLVSSHYIFDCVKENYLLDVNDYVFTISEAETSDISDEESQFGNRKPLLVNFRSILPNLNEAPSEMDIEDVDVSSLDEKMNCANTNVSVSSKPSGTIHNLTTSTESFIEGSQEVNLNSKIVSGISFNHVRSQDRKPLTSTAKDPLTTSNVTIDLTELAKDCSPIDGSQSLVSEKVVDVFAVANPENDSPQLVPNAEITSPDSPSPVSSSQPDKNDLDQFDNLILNKAQQNNPTDDEECLSQSYTVSSSADAQVTTKPDSAEIFAQPGPSAVPDSPTLSASSPCDRYSYILKLETEVEKILQKPSPKSIQDKMCLVKYICCVKKLPPAVVLPSLQSL